MALAGALHHSSCPSRKVVDRHKRQEEVEHETHNAPRGPKTPPPGQRPALLTEPAPQERLADAGHAATCEYEWRGGRRPHPRLPLPRKAVEERMVDELKEEEAKKAEEETVARPEGEEDSDGWQLALDSDGDWTQAQGRGVMSTGTWPP